LEILKIIKSKSPQTCVCESVTSKIEKLNLENTNTNDFNIKILVLRCKKIKDLNLYGKYTRISEQAISDIILNLPLLEKISLPDQMPFEQLVRLATEMPKLKQICWENQLSHEQSEAWNQFCPNVFFKGLISESFSLWLHPPKNVQNHYLEIEIF
jgi:hypothetical protein